MPGRFALLCLSLAFTLPPVLLLASSSHASLIANGSFEASLGSCPDPSGGGYAVYSSPSAQCISGWNVISANVHYIGAYWQAADGVLSIDLDGLGGASGGIEQTFASDVGATYLVTFSMAGNPDNIPVVKPMRVAAAGQSADFEFNTTGKTHSDMGWTRMQWTFVATDVTTALSFQSLTGELGLATGWGAVVDDVSVVPVPEPAPALLLMLGILALVHYRRAVAERG